MINQTKINAWRSVLAVAMLSAGLIVFSAFSGHSHGGKTHASQSLSAFEAVQKATSLYDRLIVSGRLSEAW